MRRALTDDYAVPCPLCKAERGDMCINIGHGTRFQGEVHRERRRESMKRLAAISQKLNRQVHRGV